MDIFTARQVLGVDADADLGAVTRAYKSAAKLHHPDLNPGDAAAEERFKEVGEAHTVLLGRLSSGTRLDSTEGAVAGDIFIDIQVELRVAVHGGRITVPAGSADCAACDGSGVIGEPQVCPVCNGQRATVQSIGIISAAVRCTECRGRGEILPPNCASCAGTGRVTCASTVMVEVPPGSDDGDLLVVAGAGRAGGGRVGDLNARIAVLPDARFTRSGFNISHVSTVPFALLCLGGHVTVPDLKGEQHRLVIKPGTRDGKRLVVEGAGVPRPQGGAGDLLVRLQVLVPEALSQRSEQLLRAFQKSLMDSPGNR